MTDPRVIVVGGGLSGLSAAHTLYQRGANVLSKPQRSSAGPEVAEATAIALPPCPPAGCCPAVYVGLEKLQMLIVIVSHSFG